MDKESIQRETLNLYMCSWLIFEKHNRRRLDVDLVSQFRSKIKKRPINYSSTRKTENLKILKLDIKPKAFNLITMHVSSRPKIESMFTFSLLIYTWAHVLLYQNWSKRAKNNENDKIIYNHRNVSTIINL